MNAATTAWQRELDRWRTEDVMKFFARFEGDEKILSG
jgi:hypothetical protein